MRMKKGAKLSFLFIFFFTVAHLSGFLHSRPPTLHWWNPHQQPPLPDQDEADHRRSTHLHSGGVSVWETEHYQLHTEGEKHHFEL